VHLEANSSTYSSINGLMKLQHSGMSPDAKSEVSEWCVEAGYGDCSACPEWLGV